MTEPFRPSPAARIIVGVLGLALLFGPWIAAIGGARSDPIATENRALAKRPTWRGFATLKDITNFAADHFPLRDSAVSVDDKVGKVAVAAQPSGPAGPSVAGPNGASPKGTTALPPTVKGKNGWLFLSEDFTRACEPDWPMYDALNGLKRLSSIISKSGRQLVISVIPDKSTAEPQFLPSTYALQDCSTRVKAERRTALAKLRLTTLVDVLPMLRADEKTIGAPAYLPRDTHWTDRSSALFVQAIAYRLQPSLERGTTLQRTHVGKNQQDLGLLVGDTRLLPDPAYATVRAGVERHVEQTRLAPGDAYEIRTIRATTSGPAAVFTPKTLWIGDSFSDHAIDDIAAYFADLTEMPDMTKAKNVGKTTDGRNLYNVALPIMMRNIKDSKAIVLAATERYFFGQKDGSLLDDKFLDQLEKALR
ncbi:MAG: hypothetical protein QOF21_2879 [Actinomycetota bacterium]|jgi:hypothetical protein